MLASTDRLFMSADEYLAWEEQQAFRHEYLHGEAYAMTGGTLPHNDLAVNLTTLLKSYLKGRGCKVRMADAKVGLSESGPFFYPDVLVTCDDRDVKAKTMVQYPCLIIEVLLPGTEGYDRGEKFRQYRRLETLKEYVLVNAETMGVESFQLNSQNKWELTAYFADDIIQDAESVLVHFTSIDFQCSLAAIYDEVELPEPRLS
ncbi:MAG: Uma2 family endonuclease [Drouetiella hepatica Uher 2000/2452]|jgi:Uma2 family endonuclease|uniref:Uma2 family endonuclease n=1 Tax=Drouetiella hepatica Uher 2000/2452 TaxID=904376 RepID=A0A951Q8Y4_9CYAN|nr:Uma2 family endonuclease [Drouetiella hepatica Uher 2000/2452]